jgi:phosphatidylglycerol lysyltransferase
VLALLSRHGWNATSFQILETGFRYWFDGDRGCVAYVDTGSAWVVAGSPVAGLEDLPAVAAGILRAARAEGRRVCCFGTENRFHQATGWPALRIGDQPTWVPAAWSELLARSRSLREQLRRARAKGVVVRQVSPEELRPGAAVRSQLEGLIGRWLATRQMAPMGFLVQVQPFLHPEERRIFVAEQDGRVLGFLGVVPVYARDGWLFEDFLRDPLAPNGTVELLLDAGMRAARAEGRAYVTLGLVPLAGEVGPWLRAARRMGRQLYDFDGLRAFKAKLAPQAWDPIYLAYPPGARPWRATLDTLTAFARGGLLRFGIETLLRGPAIVMRLLAVLLVPWTLLMALPQSRPWFPSALVQGAWVTFDVLLCIALLALGRRWRPALANLIAPAVTCDAALTFVQAVAFDRSREHGALGLVVICVAVLAPTLAAVLLWNARAHRARASARGRPSV